MFFIKSLKEIAIFVAGGAMGAFAAWRYLEKKYGEKIEDLESRVERLSSRLDKEPDTQIEEPHTEPSITREPQSIFEKPELSSYTRYSEHAKTYQGEEEDAEMRQYKKPYIIHPDQFGELDEYDTISLMYYIDCKLADDDDNLIENVDEVVGWDSLGHFGEFDADTVYVRNERLRIDYEICRSERAYADIMEARPYLRRDNDYDGAD